MISSEVRETAEGETQGGRQFCSATTKAGRVCGAPVLRDGLGFCWTHAPGLAEKRREAQRRGGSTTQKRRQLLMGRIGFRNAESILAFREALAAAALMGQVVPARGTLALAAARDAEEAWFKKQTRARLANLEERLAAFIAGQREVQRV